ncbi:MAG TPA: imidazolonepropionase [Spirochaetia bacterium]|nr:imidazolonepropionase [Spirochaetia bacterium]
MTLFRNARIATPVDGGVPAAGPRQGELLQWETGALAVEDGRIVAVGDDRSVTRGLHASQVESETDCLGRCLVPGFVDPHTHLCFCSPREGEFAARLSGADYREILRQGGGILASVREVRAVSEQALFDMTSKRALSALRHGSTTIEIKSGYGLSTEAELKQLRVVRRIGEDLPLHVVPTFLGAHAVAPEYQGDAEGYVDSLVSDMIPAVSASGLARFCDVFCEQGVFSTAQSRRVLEEARAAGLGLKVHADELSATGGAELAASLNAVSADHLLAASEAGLKAMARAGVVAVLLPGTAYSMRKPYAPARKMIAMGLPVALATDCNPGTSLTVSMPFVFSLAVLQIGMTVAESLAACTLNAAYALGMGKETGSLSTGKRADFLLLEGETPAILAFHAGASPVFRVYVNGRLAWSSEEP